ncbi:DUF4173 domain-containing protein [Candidatus Peregrinibacteria bacterium]|nr:DUF4173 domain-containing protein [Candidatus Peregrinibacteria bacterium]
MKITTDIKISSGLLLIPAYILGVVFNYFWGEYWGVSYPIMITLIMATYLILGKHKKIEKNWLILIPLFALSLTFAIFDNQTLRLINHFLVPALLIASILLIKYPKLDFHRGLLLELIVDKIYSTFENIVKPYKGISTQDVGVGAGIKKTFKSLLVALPIIIVVIALLSSADKIFSNSINDFIDNLFDLDADGSIIRSILMIITASTIFGGLLYASLNTKREWTEVEREELRPWDSFTPKIVLGSLLIIYVYFCFIQFKYLFGGIENIGEFTYAEYARQGFFELMAVGVINLTLILSIFRFTRQKRKTEKIWLKTLSVLTILSTFIIIASSDTRLRLYEQTYGYTQARIFAHVMILLLFIIFLHLLYKIAIKENSSFKKTLAVSALSLYTILNFINVDGFIAEKNIERYEETGKIDLAYLKRLSVDAVPEVIKLELNDDRYKNSLGSYINHQYDKVINLDESQWYSYNYFRKQAYENLKDKTEYADKLIKTPIQPVHPTETTKRYSEPY